MKARNKVSKMYHSKSRISDPDAVHACGEGLHSITGLSLHSDHHHVIRQIRVWVTGLNYMGADGAVQQGPPGRGPLHQGWLVRK